MKGKIKISSRGKLQMLGKREKKNKERKKKWKMLLWTNGAEIWSRNSTFSCRNSATQKNWEHVTLGPEIALFRAEIALPRKIENMLHVHPAGLLYFLALSFSTSLYQDNDLYQKVKAKSKQALPGEVHSSSLNLKNID